MGIKPLPPRYPPRLRCPRCGQPALKIEHALDLPPDSRSDEISVQLVACSGCGFRGLGVYEESRRGREEAVDHRVWIISKDIWISLLGAVKSCPEPRNPRCTCPVHLEWGAKNEYGRWRGLAEERTGDWFHLEISFD